TAGVGGARVDVWRSAGGGAFLPAVVSSIGNQAGVLAVGDFDDDGVLDLTAVSATTGELLLLHGDGHGSFATIDAAALSGGSVESLAVGDFDGDGWLDVAAAGGAQIEVVFGQGVVWRGSELLGGGAAVTRSVAAHDIGGDGRCEVLCATGAAEVAVSSGRRAAPAGLSNYGVGTPDCAGRIGMWANGSPRLGNLEFAYTVTNAPRSTFGFLLQGGPEDVAGSDPFGIGVLLHIGLGFVNTELVFTDALGRAVLPRPVPNDPGLVGLPVYVQTLWQGVVPGTCASSSQGISSSIGLICTVQQ
ncbi:MAG: VCBS repeat-containing protein, partial [Planctomycetes bacterium]|nr:VCBS repeat-containing protein [Planctomycetota bacterium]